MTPHQASKVVLTLAIAIFCALFFFNLGRLTNSTLTIKDGCQTLSYATPFKGTLP